MGDKFLIGLADYSNYVIHMLKDCKKEIAEYVTSQISNNGYVFLDDLQQLDEKGDL